MERLQQTESHVSSALAIRPFRVQSAALLTALVICVSLAHWPSLESKALFVDDYAYVINNPLVMHPSWDSTSRFFTEVLQPSTVRGYYQPLAMISLMLDVAMGGGPENLELFHRTSLILHVLNTALVAVVLYQLFGNIPAATLMAVIFGVHPLTVEPVVWIADRKTLLAAFFALISMSCYLRFVHRRGWISYSSMTLAFALSVLSKPTAAMLPIALLLIDIWPLQRLSLRSIRRNVWGIFVEKLPLFAILAVSGFIAYWSSKISLDTTEVGESNPLTFLLALCHNIAFYFWKILWPVNLTPHYPFPPSIKLIDSTMIIGLIVCTVILAICLIGFRRTRAPLIGFVTFVILLLPTLSIMKQTITLTSDKYIYFPVIGLLMVGCAAMAVVLSGPFQSKKNWARPAIWLAIPILLLAEITASRNYAKEWRDTDALYTRVVNLAPQSSFARFGRGHYYYSLGNWNLAESDWRQAVRLQPANINAIYNLGLLLEETSRQEEALTLYENALRFSPQNVEILVASGLALQNVGRTTEAERRFRVAVRVSPASVNAASSLANLLADTNRLEQAREIFQRLADSHPNHADVLNNYGRVLLRLSRNEEARPILEKAVSLSPKSVAARFNLGTVLLNSNRAAQAVAQFEEAARIVPGDTRIIIKLATSMAAAGRTADAILICESALQASPGNAEITAILDSLKKGLAGGA
ncbi:MAG: tetratricopeptide repeat protein [Planctomycetes bacterium]|nr:tetratricopeptide repeat protein [Planctomycetota bacterium]